jgi:hypothetical protein
MSSTPQSIPLTRRIQGGLAIAVGVLVAIAVAVTLIAVTGANNPAQRTVKPKPKSVTPTLSSTLASLPPQERRYVQAIAALSPGQLAAGYGTSLAAAVGNKASSPTVQPNPDQQRITSHSLGLLGKVLPGWHGGELPGWLLR